MNQIPQIFNREKVKLHRNRAAKNIDKYDFIIAEAGDEIMQRLEDMQRNFYNILVIGCVSAKLLSDIKDKYKHAEILVQDISYKLSAKADLSAVVADEEKNCFASQTFDLVVCNMTLHAVNDLPGSLIQIRSNLQKNGVFIGSIFGDETISELRQSITKAESNYSDRAAVRVIPFADVKTLGSLLQRCGFELPVADALRLKAAYADASELMTDIRGMGESNSLVKQSGGLNSGLVNEIDKCYKSDFSDGEGGIIATFDIIYLTGLAANDK